MRTPWAIPTYLTYYYTDQPFRSLTDLAEEDRRRTIEGFTFWKDDPRMRSTYYFEQRIRYEETMHRQFREKGGQPDRCRPFYAVLGESEIWARITRKSIRLSLSDIPVSQVSFTYTDSWPTYIDRDLDGNVIPRKSQYGTVYRLDELDELFCAHGWPGERWKTEKDWEHDLYVEAQIWSNEPLRRLAQAE